ncbi:MAG: dipeptidase, partial [Bacteroidales bacterium]
MENIKNYIQKNRDRFLEELFGLIRIPSISSEASHKEDMIKAAEYWKKAILEAGADKAELMATDGNPVVYGEKIIDAKARTVLVYGHYDVMPVDPKELWKTSPFEPQIREGRIYARGANDDKGQAFMHAKALEYMVKEKCLPCNVKFMIEGEEEIGSPSMEKWCIQNKERLKADIILVSDTSMIATDIPSITVGLRGLSYVEVKVTGPNKDLHSGKFGGAVANPANVLSKMIASLIDENGHITIPGFYEDVLLFSDLERSRMAKVPFSQNIYNEALDINKECGEKGFTTLERTGIRPSLDVNGLWSGYTGEGAKTVLPSVACAKISMRLVPNQKWEKVGKQISDYLKKIAGQEVKVEVTLLHGGQAYGCALDLPAYRAAEKAYEEVFGIKPIPTRSGGSIPVISTFEKVLGIKSILMGFGLEED